MTTVDGFVPQRDVVGHSKTKVGILKNEEIVDDWELYDLGSDDSMILATFSELIFDYPDDSVKFDESKLSLLKSKMGESKVIQIGNDNKKKKRRRRKRRKKSKPVLDIEFHDGVFIQSSLSRVVLEMEVINSISIPSSLQPMKLDVQVDDGLFFSSLNQIDIVSSPSQMAADCMNLNLTTTSCSGVDGNGSSNNPSVISCIYDEHDSLYQQQQQNQIQQQHLKCSADAASQPNDSSEFNSGVSFGYDLYDSHSCLSTVSSDGNSNSNTYREIISLQSLKIVLTIGILKCLIKVVLINYQLHHLIFIQLQ